MTTEKKLKLGNCPMCETEMVGFGYCLPCQIERLTEDLKRERNTSSKYWSVAYSACEQIARQENKSTTEVLNEYEQKYEQAKSKIVSF